MLVDNLSSGVPHLPVEGTGGPGSVAGPFMVLDDPGLRTRKIEQSQGRRSCRLTRQASKKSHTMLETGREAWAFICQPVMSSFVSC